MMRFNHMELTFAPGALTPSTRESIVGFYTDVFGWSSTETDVLGMSCLLLQLDPYTNQFLLLAENERPLSAPGYDHLGLLQDSRAEVDRLLDACKRFQQTDDRVQIKEYKDLVSPGMTVHAFYVKYLLPIWFDVQSMERAHAVPTWTYA